MLAVAGAKTDAERLLHAAPQRGESGETGPLFEPRQSLTGIGRKEEGYIGWPGQWCLRQQAALKKIGKAAQQSFGSESVCEPPKSRFVVREIEAFAHSSRLVQQPVLPKIRGEHETVSWEIPVLYLIAVKERLNAVIGAFDFDHTAIGRDAGAPLGTFASSENGSVEQAKVGNTISA
jgi:hypothetical protein